MVLTMCVTVIVFLSWFISLGLFLCFKLGLEIHENGRKLKELQYLLHRISKDVLDIKKAHLSLEHNEQQDRTQNEDHSNQQKRILINTNGSETVTRNSSIPVEIRARANMNIEYTKDEIDVAAKARLVKDEDQPTTEDSKVVEK